MRTDINELRADAEEHLAKLPEIAFSELPGRGVIVIIKRGESGYYPTQDTYVGRDVDELNASLGVTPAQAEAMLNGSIFGWHVPAADPEQWDAMTAYKSAQARSRRLS